MFSCYTQLAQHFQSRRDNHTGVYFLEKCLEIARLTKDAVSEMLANHNLGLAHEQVGGSCCCCSSCSCSCSCLCPCCCRRPCYCGCCSSAIVTAETATTVAVALLLVFFVCVGGVSLRLWRAPLYVHWAPVVCVLRSIVVELQMGNLDDAISYHQFHQNLARVVSDFPQQGAACTELVGHPAAAVLLLFMTPVPAFPTVRSCVMDGCTNLTSAGFFVCRSRCAAARRVRWRQPATLRGLCSCTSCAWSAPRWAVHLAFMCFRVSHDCCRPCPFGSKLSVVV